MPNLLGSIPNIVKIVEELMLMFEFSDGLVMVSGVCWVCDLVVDL
jgi:hypothetical protein